MPTQPNPHALDLDLEIQRQPDDATCGPTCLHAVYRYYDDVITLDEIIAGVRQLDTGGSLAVDLANHALRRGYRALIYTYNLTVFDPSWFGGRRESIRERLVEQARLKADPKLGDATAAYLEYLDLGGELAMEDLSPALLRRWLERNRPILTGLSATFLYRSPREVGTDTLQLDDLRGDPTGHFVVLSGYDGEARMVRVADPLEAHPEFRRRIYWIPVDRVINAVLLGVLTYDANLLLLEPPEKDET